ncbi:unnamed protein product [Zymoseptoria tritici ST99CH_1A5]|uniref:Major facilitator superfamily (MFS) profile domain-containing protein n=1 Tax=Zymoseptoria tritici ST99CH_1A5 TaxID=1276529 RepID=A0A1Y6L911_ZYMTR|nr:unnamed protein product [Zymoseptoria tritici ST99CH_1A5]
MATTEKHHEASTPEPLSFFSQVFHPTGITSSVENYHYKGSGTAEDPYVVVWIDHDPRNPMNWSSKRRWIITMLVATALLAVAFDSSAYSAGGQLIIMEFGTVQIVFTLGVSLFVLGFAIGPLLWAPMSEMFGRQVMFAFTYGILTAFNGGAIASPNIQSLVILRFFAGAFGASPLTMAGGVIADMFPARERGLAMSMFSAAPFMGPVLGPIVGGFVGETVGWRWIMGVITIFTGVLWIALLIFLPETYAPVILRKRAEALSKKTGMVYKSRAQVEQGDTSIGELFKTSLSRPWVLLFKEPIVLLLSIYMSIIYGTLYGLFGAFPIVFQQVRGWSTGIGGLAFLGVMVGMFAAIAYNAWDNKRYVKINDESDGFAPPEARMPPAIVGAIAIPIGLIWFAWTNYPSIHWFACIAAGAPFGFGMVLVFVAIFNYLIDSYTIFAASVLAANTVMRSVVGAAFPLFIPYMYDGLGIHWATMIPGFLAVICVPFPFLFYKYGAQIRKKCKYAAESEAFIRRMQKEAEQGDDDGEKGEDDASFEDHDSSEGGEDVEKEKEENKERPSEATYIAYGPREVMLETEEAERLERLDAEARRNEGMEAREEVEEPLPGSDPAVVAAKKSGSLRRLDSNASVDTTGQPKFERIKSTRSRASSRGANGSGLVRVKTYESNPFDLDRVNTRESFVRVKSKKSLREEGSGDLRGRQ